MKDTKNFNIALLAVVSRGAKLFLGPITLLIISAQLSSDELGYYYTFFSFISMQMLVELGIGHVIKQYISHAYIEKDGEWLESSKIKIKRYYYFSIYWFVGVALFLMFVVYFSGYMYFSGIKNSGDVISWKGAWLCLILVSSFSTLLTPVQILLDGIQRQETILRANIAYGIANALAIWCALYLGLGLYSISVSIFLSNLVLYMFIRKPLLNTTTKLNSIAVEMRIKKTFNEISPLLFKVSIVWGLGFIFWNCFNIILMYELPSDIAGKVIFSIVLARAGYGIAESMTQSQSTIYSNLIAQGKDGLAKKIFNKYSMIACAILVVGYLLFYLIWYFFPSIYVFEKIPNKQVVFCVFIFFILQLYKSLRTNFIRCYKVEPFVTVSVFEALSLPLFFYFGLKQGIEMAFVYSWIVVIIGLIWSIKIEVKFMDVINEN